MFNLPNLISLLRLFLGPVSIWLICQGLILEAFWVFIFAGVSDAVDGFLAKTFDMETELGKFLDPIADKGLLVCVYAALGYEGYLDAMLVFLVIGRDAAIMVGALVMHFTTHNLKMKPMLMSKVNTMMQIVLAGFVLGEAGFGVDVGSAILVLALIVTVTTVWSWIGYGLVLARGTRQ